jgi:hypothetical protein
VVPDINAQQRAATAYDVGRAFGPLRDASPSAQSGTGTAHDRRITAVPDFLLDRWLAL